MSLLLHITGDVTPDGWPVTRPHQVHWIHSPAGAQEDPGFAEGYASDRKDGLIRTLRRPHPSSLYAAPWIPPQVHSDGVNSSPPLGGGTVLGRVGIMLARDMSVNECDDWDLSAWTQSSISSVSGSQEGPGAETSGDGQAYLITPSVTDGYVEDTYTTTTNMNADTYVFSVWLRKADGASGPSSITLRSGASGTTIHVDLTDEWQLVQVTSPNENSTSATLRIYPGGEAAHPSGEDTSAVLAWGPTLENLEGGAADSNVPATGTVVASGHRESVALLTDFAWPAPPWTLRFDYTPLYDSDSQLTHTLFRVISVAGNVVYRFYNEDTEMILDVGHRDGTTDIHALEPNPPNFAKRSTHRMVITLDSNGELRNWFDAASGGLIASGVYPAEGGDTLEFNSTVNGADAILHRFEVWDRLIDPQRLI